MSIIKNYINGNLSCISDRFSEVYDPSKGEQTSKVVLSNRNDFDETIKSSKTAFLKWSNITPLNRSRILQKYKNLIEKNIDELAKLVSSEHGKTIDDAKGSVIRGLEVVEFACGIPHL